MPAFSWIMGGPVGPLLQLRLNVFARLLAPAGILKSSRKTPDILEAYKAPFPTPKSRMGTYVFHRSIRMESRWLAYIESKLSRLIHLPIHKVWAMKDPAFGSDAYIRRWQTHFPDAPVDRIETASHSLQEDYPECIVSAVESMLLKNVE